MRCVITTWGSSMCWCQTKVYSVGVWIWLNQVLSATERQITDSLILSTVTYSPDKNKAPRWDKYMALSSTKIFRSKHALCWIASHDNEPSSCSVLAFSNAVTSTAGVSDLSPSVAAARHGRPTGKKNTSFSTILRFSPLPLTSPLFSTPSPRSPPGNFPSHMRRAHAPALSVP